VENECFMEKVNPNSFKKKRKGKEGARLQENQS
jgi:hypothetical protein